MKYNITIFIWLIGLFLFLSSCNITKYVPEDKLLLSKKKIEVDGDKSKISKLNPYVIQQPNYKVAGLFPIGLVFYNLSNEEYEEKWNQRIEEYKDSTHLFPKIFSLKQAIGYANFRKSLSEWFIKNGEAPVLYDEIKTQKTLRNLELYYIYQGFFKSEVSYELDTISSKKAKVTYNIITQNPYTIDSIKHQIASPIIDSLYRLHQDKSYVKEGKQFKRNDFESEADRLTKIFRNAGVYHFSKLSINFIDTDSTRTDYKTNITLDIADRLVDNNGEISSIDYKISHIEKVKIYTDYSYLQRNDFLRDSANYKGIDFYAYEQIKYNPKHLSHSIFIKPGEKFSDTNNDLTRQHLRRLNNFKTIRIRYEELSDNKLIAHILLTPSKRYGGKIEAEAIHSNQKPLGISGKLSFKNNNTLGGNEILKLGLQGSFLNSVEFANDNKFFNAWELGMDLSLKVPRIMMPFNTHKLIPDYMSPKTAFTLGTSLQKNIGLDKQRFTGIIEYNWKASKKANHTVELINAQYIRNLNIHSFFDVYSSEYTKLETIQLNNSDIFPSELLNNPLSFVQTALSNASFKLNNPQDYNKIRNVKERYRIITEDILVPSISYQYIYNTQANYKDLNFSFLRTRISSSGLVTSLFAKSPNENSPKQVLGINVAQYLKLDIEYRKHWDFNSHDVLAFRTNFGIAIPYGNSTSIPFSRSYFAGGPNDIRAWRIYELGPGSEDSGLEFNVGNLKLISSIEYRFNIFGSFKGAFFADAGNIWDVTNNDLASEESKFTNLSSLESIALGTGFGMRYDFSFLVFRADLGFKTYEPYKPTGDKWFQKTSLKKPILNIGINYPF